MANKTSTFTNNLPPAVDATWYNINQTEMNNLITGSGLTVDNTGAINTQQQQSASRFAANNFYIDSGAADAYVLTLAASFTNPVSATVGYFVGMTIRFRAGNAGTGGAATVNVNQAGTKNLKEADGTTNPISIPTTEDTEWRYDGTVFRKVIFSTIGFSAHLSSNQIINTSINTKINFSTAIVNRNDNSIFNTATSRFTPTVAGWYNINCGLFFNAPLAPNNAFACNAIIYKNGAMYKGNNQSYCQNVNHEVINSFFLFMNGSTDYLELYGIAGSINATYTIIGGDSSYFQAFKI